jgi:electron transport complex protein RnfC
MPALHSFPGGLNLPEHKEATSSAVIEALPLPPRLVLPLVQHLGAAALPCVTVGVQVRKGEVVARAAAGVSAALHAPSSGTVVAIEDRPVPHASGMSATCIVIETDGHDDWRARRPLDDWAECPPAVLRSRIAENGIVGLGGAGFPSHVKLDPAARQVELLIVNGVECEPYLACDDRLMRERAHEVVLGAHLMQRALGAAHCTLAIEDNKPEAHAALRTACDTLGVQLELVRVPTRYPAGGERQLIQTLTGREVPSQGLPSDLGLVCHNVGTAAAVYRAIVHDEPLISRIVTVAGAGVARAANFDVLLGTPISHLITAAGGYTAGAQRLVLGGPMMGITLPDDDLPVIKTTNGLLVESEALSAPELPCIRCGECASVCPASLQPQDIHWHARAREFDQAQEKRLFDCIECGCCDYVCPSHIPLVAWFRHAKTTIWDEGRRRERAERARARHQARGARLQRMEAARGARLAERRAALETRAADDADPKRAVIAAALERVRARRAANEDHGED